MSRGLVATAQTVIDAPVEKVWAALVTPEQIKHYMFGTNVVSDWKPGSRIIWKGEWQGKSYEDKGVILRLEPGRLLEYSHYSPLSGVPDVPENYHNVTVSLAAEDSHTAVTLSQDNNADEAERAESAKNWAMMLSGLKQFIET